MQATIGTRTRAGGPAIAVRNLQKTYAGGVEAVKGINFDVYPGEVFGLLGPNGAGKSTTIGMLTTTIAPTGGSALLDGFDVATEPLAEQDTTDFSASQPGGTESLAEQEAEAAGAPLEHAGTTDEPEEGHGDPQQGTSR